jgi:cyclophilin family peptidyl-prolyl cis-trans isomerase
MKKAFVLGGLFLLLIACTTKADRMLIRAKIMKAENERNSDLLVSVCSSLDKTMENEGRKAAIASGRIPSFESFMLLAKTFKNNKSVTNALAVAIRFPENNFNKEAVFEMLKTFPLTSDIVETMLYLNTVRAFNFVMSVKGFEKTTAFNLWRSKDFVTDDVLNKYYKLNPQETIYSLFRLKKKGIVKASDLKICDLSTRAYGCYVCDNPSRLLGDKNWQVRVFALKACNSKDTAKQLLKDGNPLVRETALQIFLQKKGRLSENITDLSPVECEVLLSNTKNVKIAEAVYKAGGIFSEIAAPFLDKKSKERVLGDKLSTKSKIAFIENNFSKDEALQYAMDKFMFENDVYGLIYILDNGNGLFKKQAVEKAIKSGDKFLSVLTDYEDIRKGYHLAKTEEKPLFYYINILNVLKKYKGFTVKTAKGDIVCDFFVNEAPLTCFNIVTLVKDGYYKNLRFHRVVPAFVAQDGDPTGTGSGGPGYSIRCEYNRLKYDKKGVVGMALAGKDTGGSQYFLTHIATPHLNHKYTVFAEMKSGGDVLDTLVKYDEIEEIVLNER